MIAIKVAQRELPSIRSAADSVLNQLRSEFPFRRPSHLHRPHAVRQAINDQHLGTRLPIEVEQHHTSRVLNRIEPQLRTQLALGVLQPGTDEPLVLLGRVVEEIVPAIAIEILNQSQPNIFRRVPDEDGIGQLAVRLLEHQKRISLPHRNQVLQCVVIHVADHQTPRLRIDIGQPNLTLLFPVSRGTLELDHEPVRSSKVRQIGTSIPIEITRTQRHHRAVNGELLQFQPPVIGDLIRSPVVLISCLGCLWFGTLEQ